MRASRATCEASGEGRASRRGSRWLWAAAALASAAPASARVVVDRPVAVVDGELILASELEALPALHAAPGHRSAGPQEQRALRHRALDEEINERLLGRQVSRLRDQLGVGEADVDRAVEEVRVANQLTEAQLGQALAAQGLTQAEYRAKLLAQIERARAVQMRMQGLPEPGTEAVRQRCLTAGTQARAHHKLCAQHVLVPLEEGAAPAAAQRARQRADALLRELRGGAGFAEVLRRALAAGDGVQGGTLGCFGHGEMVENFEAAAFALEPGQHSDVVETPVGLHIIFLDQRQAVDAPGCTSPQELEPHRQALQQEEMQRQLARWIEELRAQAAIEIRL